MGISIWAGSPNREYRIPIPELSEEPREPGSLWVYDGQKLVPLPATDIADQLLTSDPTNKLGMRWASPEAETESTSSVADHAVLNILQEILSVLRNIEDQSSFVTDVNLNTSDDNAN